MSIVTSFELDAYKFYLAGRWKFVEEIERQFDDLYIHEAHFDCMVCDCSWFLRRTVSLVRYSNFTNELGYTLHPVTFSEGQSCYCSCHYDNRPVIKEE